MGRPVVLGKDLAKHVAVMFHREISLDNDVVADVGAVADGVSDGGATFSPSGTSCSRKITLRKWSCSMFAVAGPRARLSAAAKVLLPEARVASQHDQVRCVLHMADASGRHARSSA